MPILDLSIDELLTTTRSVTGIGLHPQHGLILLSRAIGILDLRCLVLLQEPCHAHHYLRVFSAL